MVIAVEEIIEQDEGKEEWEGNWYEWRKEDGI